MLTPWTSPYWENSLHISSLVAPGGARAKKMQAHAAGAPTWRSQEGSQKMHIEQHSLAAEALVHQQMTNICQASVPAVRCH
jgi:hypothetical protein